MLTSQQDAQHKRGEGIGRDQPGHFWFQKSIIAAVANHQQQFRDCELHENYSKDEKDPRASRKAFWLIDPELRYCRRQDQKRNDKILGRFRLLPAKNKKSQPASERCKDHQLRIRGVLEVPPEFTPRPAAASFP